jgi:3-hydroxyacyl-[acyl-carrier-protein] dehydratase
MTTERLTIESPPPTPAAEDLKPAAPAMDIRQILQNLPHRYPLLLVDRLLEMDPDRARGIKQLSVNEWFFQGHFPDAPEMPCSLLLESMGQIGAAAILARPENKGKLLFLAGMDNVEIEREAYPGQTLTMNARLLRYRSGESGRTEVTCVADDVKLARAEYTFVLTGDVNVDE